MREHKWINIVDADTSKIREYCKWNEETFDNNILTGINFTQTNDGKYLLGLVFVDDKAREKSLEKSKEYNFEKIVEEDIDWVGYMGMAKLLYLGNFSYKNLDGK